MSTLVCAMEWKRFCEVCGDEEGVVDWEVSWEVVCEHNRGVVCEVDVEMACDGS
jgi:hypothetical protein